MIWIIWLVYILAVAVHMVCKAAYAINSPHTPWGNVREYVGKFWMFLVPRWFFAIVLMLLVWDNPRLLGALAISDMFFATATAQVGAAMVLGWFSDSFGDKIIGLVGIKRKPKPLPGDDQDFIEST